MSFTYPPAPEHATDAVLRPSAAFKAELTKVVVSLVLFMFLYTLLLAISVGLAIGLGMIALSILSSVPNIWVMLFAISLVAVGFLTFFFLIKFLFATTKEDRSGFTEITENSHPDLFSFIRQISIETNTSFPGHIYLSQDVNAMVFYDSNFWSLFFPVKKNLVIGLGLVNMSNMSELKAVIAHEFGHFSQKSMKAGSYVYQANKVIYNMLYENKSIANFIDSVSGFHAIVSFCMGIAVKIIQAFQWVLRQAYRSINKTYSGLSRQMEFDADAMSAKVAGSNNAIHMLRRIEFADSCHTATIGCYNEWLEEGYKGKNLYTQQRVIAKYLAKAHELQLSNGLPLLNDNTRPGSDAYTRVNVKDQWASHPTMKDREQHLEKIGLNAPVVDESPWVLFPDAQELQEQFTEKLYDGVSIKGEIVTLTDDLFAEKFHSKQEDSSYPEFYKGYYRGRSMAAFDPDDAENSELSTIDDIDSFLDERKNALDRRAGANRDLEILEFISSKGSGVRSFDLEGRKYKRADSMVVHAQISQDVQKMEAEFVESDKRLTLYFLEKAAQVSGENRGLLMDLLKKYFAVRQICVDNEKVREHLAPLINAFFEKQDLDRAAVTAGALKEAAPFFVSRIEKLKGLLGELGVQDICPFPSDIDLARIGYMSYTRGDGTFNDANLQELIGYVNSFGNWNIDIMFRMQKLLAEKQLVYSGLAT